MAEAEAGAVAGEQAPAEDRAAMRAFLQRSEVRLSTLHRIATALLSGAGILVLLPAVERDSVVSVLRALLDAELTARRSLLVLCVAASVVLTIAVIWFLLVELTRFYFHANHVEHDGLSVFTPRFTLTGLRLPDDELGPGAAASLAASRTASHNVGLLVPSNDRSRARIDRQVTAYPGLAVDPVCDDRSRSDALFELAASRSRALTDEVAKVEFGMVRHMLRIQVIVLRYVKALLVVLTTVLAAFVMAAAVQGPTPIDASTERWVAATMALWAPAVVIAASSPVRWLDRLLRAEGATQLELRRDPELTHLEDVTARLATGVWVAATVAGVPLVLDRFATGAGRAAMAGSLVVAAVLQVLALRRWAGRGVFARLLGLPRPTTRAA
jgi:hypothetical protein